MTKLPADHQVSYLHGSRRVRRAAKDLTPMRAIRAYCLDCGNGSAKEVALCVIPACPLFPYRMGRRPTYIDFGAVEGHLAGPSRAPSTSVDSEHQDGPASVPTAPECVLPLEAP